jgi:hypothetical protein
MDKSIEAVPVGWVGDGGGVWRREHPTTDLLISIQGDEYQVFIGDRHEASRTTLARAAAFVDAVLDGRVAKQPIVA